jgi:drug/metabolite transporter superfamily protein YnfA
VLAWFGRQRTNVVWKGRDGYVWWRDCFNPYALLDAQQPTGFSRTFAAYGGVFVASSVTSGWLYDGSCLINGML